MAAIRLLLAEGGEPCLEMLEIGDQFLCRLVAVEWILAEAGCDNSVELRRTLGLHAGEGRRVLLDDPGNGRRYGRCHERIDACSQLVEHQAKREEVSPKIDGSAQRLLRRQVGRGSEDDASLRQSWVSVATDARQSEIEHFDDAVRSFDDVLGLDVAMHDPHCVRGSERLRQLSADRHDLSDGQGTELEQRAEWLAGYVLAGEIELVIDFLQSVDGCDARVRQRGGGTSFHP